MKSQTSASLKFGSPVIISSAVTKPQKTNIRVSMPKAKAKMPKLTKKK
jgi:hypothetical protein